VADLTTATDAANKQKKCGAGTACGWSLGAVIVLLITTSVLALVGYCAKKVAHEESSKELAVIEKELVEKNSLISQHGAGALSKELEEIKKELADTKEELAQGRARSLYKGHAEHGAGEIHGCLVSQQGSDREAHRREQGAQESG